jgi:hypothetical protein
MNGGTSAVEPGSSAETASPPASEPDAWLLPSALDPGEVYVKPNDEMIYLWRAVDHEGEILESYIHT